MTKASINANLSTDKETHRERIINLLNEKPERTIRFISKALGLQISTVTARISDLNDDGIVKPVGVKQVGENRIFTVYALSRPDEVNGIKLMRQKERYLRIVKTLRSDKDLHKFMTVEQKRAFDINEKL